MKKVITYGTYDLLHYGHVRLLERAKELGDYLVVGVTADGFDRVRGKINVFQTLNERMEAVRALGIADEIIVEEYEGQKIDDIKRLGIDVFTVGSDWVGKFDYLKEYCDVVYLDRTQGVSSTEIRAENDSLKVGFVGSNNVVEKYKSESEFVNGMEVVGSWIGGSRIEEFDGLLDKCDAVYIASLPKHHYEQVKKALESGKHVLCEAPLTTSFKQSKELFELAESKGLVLTEAIKTAYSTAYHRLSLLAISGRIGKVISVKSTCTSLSLQSGWTAMEAWAPTCLLPIVQLLGKEPSKMDFVKAYVAEEPGKDAFGEARLMFGPSYGTATFGNAVKSEGDLVITGTEGYIYVPAPWWKTDYFEIRKEDERQNRRFFYQLEGEGIRNQLVAFLRASRGSGQLLVDKEATLSIAKILEQFSEDKNCSLLLPLK